MMTLPLYERLKNKTSFLQLVMLLAERFGLFFFASKEVSLYKHCGRRDMLIELRKTNERMNVMY